MSAMQAMVALVLKLNEKRFKPLFVELSEWGANLPGYAAAAESDAARAAAATARRCAWLAVVSHLSRGLRSLFTPYFQNVLDVMCDAIASDSPVPLMKPSRKKQKAAPTATAADSAAPVAGGDVEVLRDRAVACMHRCCMHDTQGFVTADRFERFLAPLVARVAELGVQSDPPARAEEDTDLTAGLQLGTRTHLPHSAVAAVAALVQLGVSAQDDAAWKRLNNQVRPLPQIFAALPPSAAQMLHHTPQVPFDPVSWQQRAACCRYRRCRRGGNSSACMLAVPPTIPMRVTASRAAHPLAGHARSLSARLRMRSQCRRCLRRGQPGGMHGARGRRKRSY